MKRFLVVGYTAKLGSKEFSSIKGYILDDGEPIPSHSKIRADSLLWASRDGDGFSYFHINFMTFMDEKDYNSFFS